MRRAPQQKTRGVLREVQAAIGRHLRAEYEVMQPMPARLVALLERLERASESEGMA